jgi:hypothetical protein
MSTSARLYIDPMPRLGPDVRRFTVDCKWGTTQLWHVPSPTLDLSDRILITVVLQRHEEECGRCNLQRLWHRGDPTVKALSDAVSEQLTAAALSGRRN